MKTRVGYPDDIWTVRIWTVKIGLGFESGLGLVLGLGLGLVMTDQILTGKVNRTLVWQCVKCTYVSFLAAVYNQVRLDSDYVGLL